ncbi:MAG: DUF4215 domain-containing protein, partial [Patescibacteria group bacterium]
MAHPTTIMLKSKHLIALVIGCVGLAWGGPALAQGAQTSSTPTAQNIQTSNATADLRITKISPGSGGKGQFITIEGVGFGSEIGSVQFVQKGEATPSDIEYPKECTNLWWHDSYIIAKVPGMISSGHYEVKIKRARDSKQSLGSKFSVTDNSVGVGICGLLPDNGPGGVGVEVFGTNFGSGKGRIRFGKVEGSIADTGWGDSRVAVAAPTGADSGNVVLVTADRDLSNPVPFRLSRCTASSCGSGESCCSDGSCKLKGLCKEKPILCRYSWNFFTGIRNRLGEACKNNSECVSGVCGPDKKCARGSKSEGEACGFDAECREGFKCDQGKCTSILRRIGQSCSQASECASRLCVSGSCSQGSADVGSKCTHPDQCKTLNCYQGACGQTERCLKIESLLPLPNEVTAQSVFSAIFNQLIDEQSAKANIRLEPAVKGLSEVRTVGSGDTARSQYMFKPSEQLSLKKSYALRVDKGVKSLSSENTVGKCITGDQKKCEGSGLICSLDGSLCTRGSRCTGVGSQCSGAGSICTGVGSKCDKGATCLGTGSNCSDPGTNCLGDGSICRLGATCHGKNSQCVDPQSICKGEGSTCKDGAKCPVGSTSAAVAQCTTYGSVCPAANSACSGIGTTCTGAAAQCSNGASCTGSDSKCNGSGTQCPGSNSTCANGASCPNPQQTGKGPGQSCTANSECASGTCNTAAGVCTGGPGGPGTSCTSGAQCSSGSCINGSCGPNPAPAPSPTPVPAPTPPPGPTPPPPCLDGWKLCADAKCYFGTTCPTPPGETQCTNNGTCSATESCECQDCQGRQDSCGEQLVCRPSAHVCAAPKCGDRQVNDPREECDDANTDNEDACTNNCKLRTNGPISKPCPDGWNLCGDNKCYRGNTCPTPPGPSACNTNNQCEDNESCSCADCRGQQDSCKTGFICRPSANQCTDPKCGNGTVDSITEQCDDGNLVDTDSCTNNCKVNINPPPGPTPPPPCLDGWKLC